LLWQKWPDAAKSSIKYMTLERYRGFARHWQVLRNGNTNIAFVYSILKCYGHSRNTVFLAGCSSFFFGLAFFLGSVPGANELQPLVQRQVKRFAALGSCVA